MLYAHTPSGVVAVHTAPPARWIITFRTEVVVINKDARCAEASQTEPPIKPPVGLKKRETRIAKKFGFVRRTFRSRRRSRREDEEEE